MHCVGWQAATDPKVHCALQQKLPRQIPDWQSPSFAHSAPAGPATLPELVPPEEEVAPALVLVPEVVDALPVALPLLELPLAVEPPEETPEEAAADDSPVEAPRVLLPVEVLRSPVALSLAVELAPDEAVGPEPVAAALAVELPLVAEVSPVAELAAALTVELEPAAAVALVPTELDELELPPSAIGTQTPASQLCPAGQTLSSGQV